MRQPILIEAFQEPVTAHFPGSMNVECLQADTVKSHIHIAELAKDYIEKNFAKKIGVEEIAKKAFLSQYHFSRVFKKHTQYSPYQYLLQIRLQHARKLMYQKELSITEISYQSGFGSIDYFSAAFTKRYNICPSQYRKILMNGKMAESASLQQAG